MLLNTEIAELVRSRGRALTVWVLDDMYENPFWRARFESRGRKHAEQDAQYHITYLATAIETGSPSVMARYAEWLRSILTSRGMCTRHLDENFERLSDAMALDDVLCQQQLPFACLAEARSALKFEDPVARMVQDRERDIARSVQRQISGTEGYQLIPGVNSEDDIRYLTSFVSDAIVMQSTEQLVRHLDWMQSFLDEAEIHSDVLARLLEALEQQLAMLPEPTGPTASRVLTKARQPQSEGAR
jgi:hypothetical protein